MAGRPLKRAREKAKANGKGDPRLLLEETDRAIAQLESCLTLHSRKNAVQRMRQELLELRQLRGQLRKAMRLAPAATRPTVSPRSADLATARQIDANTFEFRSRDAAQLFADVLAHHGYKTEHRDLIVRVPADTPWSEIEWADANAFKYGTTSGRAGASRGAARAASKKANGTPTKKSNGSTNGAKRGGGSGANGAVARVAAAVAAHPSLRSEVGGPPTLAWVAAEMATHRGLSENEIIATLIAHRIRLVNRLRERIQSPPQPPPPKDLPRTATQEWRRMQAAKKNGNTTSNSAIVNFAFSKAAEDYDKQLTKTESVVFRKALRRAGGVVEVTGPQLKRAVSAVEAHRSAARDASRRRLGQRAW